MNRLAHEALSVVVCTMTLAGAAVPAAADCSNVALGGSNGGIGLIPLSSGVVVNCSGQMPRQILGTSGITGVTIDFLDGTTFAGSGVISTAPGNIVTNWTINNSSNNLAASGISLIGNGITLTNTGQLGLVAINGMAASSVQNSGMLAGVVGSKVNVANLSGGTLQGAAIDSGSLTNHGQITSGTDAVSVVRVTSGTIDNAIDGAVSATGGRVAVVAGGTVPNPNPSTGPVSNLVFTNEGSVSSDATAVVMGGAATMVNDVHGKIATTGTTAIQVFGSASLTNRGEIDGNISVSTSSGDVTLAIAPTSVIKGTVNALGDAANGKRELQLIGGGAASQTYDGSFSGFRSLTVDAQDASWTLANTQSYTDGVTVKSGTLIVGGSGLISNVSVDGGTLSNVNRRQVSGFVAVNRGGTLAPNGLFFVGNDLSLNDGSIFKVKIDGGNADLVSVDGKARIGNSSFMAMIGGGGVRIGQTYVVLQTSGNVLGTFGAVSSSSAFLNTVLTYDPQHVFVTFSAAPNGDGTGQSQGGTPIAGGLGGGTVGGGNGGSSGGGSSGGGSGSGATGSANPGTSSGLFAHVAQTRNQRAVGRALDVGNGSSSVFTSPIPLAFLPLSADQARHGYDALSGEGLTGAQNAAFHAASLFTASVTDQIQAWRMGRDGGGNTIVVGGNAALGYAPEQAPASTRPLVKAPVPARFDRNWRAWGAALGGTSALQGDAALGTAGQKDGLFGGDIGLDYQVWPNWLVGVALGGSEGAFSVDSRATSGHVDGVHGAVYSTVTLNQLYLANVTTVSSFHNTTTRVTGNFGGLAGEADHGDFDSWQLRSRFEVGRDLLLGGMRLTPFAAFEIAGLFSGGFTERSVAAGGSAGLLGLAVARQTTTSAPLFLGLRAEHRVALGDGVAVTPQASLAWVHEFAPARNLNGTLVSLAGASFIVDGARPAADAVQVNAGAQLDLTANTALFANFEGEFAAVTQAYAGRGGVRVAW